MNPRHFYLIAAACLFCLLFPSCKPSIEKQDPQDRSPAAKTTTPKTAAPKTAAPKAVDTAPAAPPTELPTFPAGIIIEREGAIEITPSTDRQGSDEIPKSGEVDMQPGDHLLVPRKDRVTLSIRRIGSVTVAGNSQVRFPEHAPCGLEHWQGMLTVEGPPFFDAKKNACWIYTPTAAVFSGKGKAEIHVAPGGQTLVHNQTGTVLVIDHDGAMQTIKPGESLTVRWKQTAVAQQSDLIQHAASFMKENPLNSDTIATISEVGQNWSSRFSQVFDVAVGLSDEHQSIMRTGQDLPTLKSREGLTKAKEIKEKLAPLIPRLQENQRKVALIYHRMNQIKRLTAQTDPEQFAAYDAKAAAALKRFPRLFKFGPSRALPQVKRRVRR